MGPFIVPEHLRCMVEITLRFPCVLRGRVSFPCGQVLLSARGALVRNYSLDFVFFFRSDQGWQGNREAGTMCVHLFEWGEKACVENIMDLPHGRQLEAVYERR